ncbi:MAG TPA: hypothetical protein VF452_15465 [Candidatus Binatia bacterium]
MTFNESQLDEKAGATVDLLLHAIMDANVIEEFYDGYEHLCRETLARFNVVPKELVEDDFQRLLFETVCFAAAFIIMSQRDLDKPDTHAIRRFKDKLLERLVYYIEATGTSKLQQVEVISITPDFRYELGHRLNPVARIDEYSALEPSKAAETFSWYFALAIDPEQYAVLKILGMHSAERVLELARIVLKAVF